MAKWLRPGNLEQRKVCIVVVTFWPDITYINFFFHAFSMLGPIFLNASQFDRRLFHSKVVSIDRSRFDRRQEPVQSVSTELSIYQICLKIFSLAVDKITKNNQVLSLCFYHHLL